MTVERQLRLETDALCVTYAPDVRALGHVTLTLRTGMSGVLGVNGAGKSTLLRVLATLQQPTAGRVVMTIPSGDIIDLVQDGAQARAQLAYLPQDFGLYPTLTVREILDHFAAVRGWSGGAERRARIEQFVDALNLGAIVDRRSSALSGGMTRRVGLALALLGTPRVPEPPLILVDEPTAGLDPAERDRALNLLAGYAERSVVVLSTHLVDDVHDLCDRAVLLHQGRVMAQGTPDDLCAPLVGRLWKGRVAREECASHRATMRVVRERVVAGGMEMFVVADERPSAAFVAVAPTLVDRFFGEAGSGA